MALLHSILLNVAIRHSTQLYFTLLWLYLTLQWLLLLYRFYHGCGRLYMTTLLHQGCTLLYLTLPYSTMALLYSTYRYM